MDIYPQDLGEKLCAQVLAAQEPAQRQSVLDANVIGLAALLCGMLTLVLGIAHLGGIAGAFGTVDVFLVGFYLKAFLFPTYSKISPRQFPASDYEIGTVQDGRRDPLERNYLTLVQAIIRTSVKDDVGAERDVREAVRALGAAIEKLPAQDADAVADDPAALYEEARQMAAQADAEPDAVIRASLQRRVASLTHRAATAERTDLLLRRNAALRAEVAEQMEALHTSLTALKVGATQGAGELAGLAASIQSVASAANAITGARAEVDSFLAAPEAENALPLRHRTG